MFNGGSRKRAMAASLHSISKQQQQRQQAANHDQARESLEHFGKRPRLASSSPETPSSMTPATHGETTPSPKPSMSGGLPPTYFPLVPLPSKSYPLPGPSTPFSPATMASPMNSQAKSSSMASQPQTDFRQSFAEFMWAGKQPSLQLQQLPYSCLLWPRPPASAALAGLGAENGLRHKLPSFPMGDTHDNFIFGQHIADKAPFWDRQASIPEPGRGNPISGAQHVSAFRPVSKVAGTPSSAEGHVIPECTSSCSPGHSTHSDDNEVDVIGGEEDGEGSQPSASGAHETTKKGASQEPGRGTASPSEVSVRHAARSVSLIYS